MCKVGAKGFTTVWSPATITTDLIMLPASQGANVLTLIIIISLINQFIYTFFISKIHYLLLNHPTLVIFGQLILVDYGNIF